MESLATGILAGGTIWLAGLMFISSLAMNDPAKTIVIVISVLTALIGIFFISWGLRRANGKLPDGQGGSNSSDTPDDWWERL